MRENRPRLSDSEIEFILDLLKETYTIRKRQHVHFVEEQEHSKLNVWSLRRRLWTEGPYDVYKTLAREKQKLAELPLWIEVEGSQVRTLDYLIKRFESILKHRGPGRAAGFHSWDRDVSAYVSSPTSE